MSTNLLHILEERLVPDTEAKSVRVKLKFPTKDFSTIKLATYQIQ